MNARFWPPLGMPRAPFLALAALFTTASACTFPDVTYSTTDGGSPPCTVSSSCGGKTTTCGKQARNAKDTCQQQPCDASPTCNTSDCTVQYEADMADCVVQCEACGELEGCTNATEHCVALANSP